MFKKFLVLFFLLVVPVSARTWTDSSGKFSTNATLADYQNGIAYLQKDDGKILVIPAVKLSKADQDFLNIKSPSVISGKVVGVTDGDTITVLDDTKTQYKIRLEGIDAPESSQAYGKHAKQALSDKVFDKDVKIEWQKKDKYQRTLGHVFVDNHWINKEMIEEGWAWHYKEYSKSAVLADAEKQARNNQAGLWKDSTPIEPWEFRNPALAESKTTESKTTESDPFETKTKTKTKATDEKEQIVYVTKTGSKYHSAGCRYLKSTIPMPLSEAAKRYSPCSVCNPPKPKEKQTTKEDFYIPPTTREPVYTPPPSSSSSDRVQVKGYYRKDGTYVRPHTRSKPSH